MSRNKPSDAASTPSTATVIAVMVPRRSSNRSATSASAPITPATSGASPLCAWSGSALVGSQNG